MSMAHARVFSLQKAGFCVSVRAGSLGGEPTARDSPQNYKGIDALQTLQLFILRDSPQNYIGIDALQTLQLFILRDV